MSRIPRHLILEDNSYFHVTWKCHNNDFLLSGNEAKAKLYQLLLKYKTKYGILIYGYCFMDNHPHIVGKCEKVRDFSRFFQVVNGQLARWVNLHSNRRGQVVMDRLKSPRIQSERYLLNVLQYIDLNPVRAGLTKNAKNYEWSSHRGRIGLKKDPLLDPLPEGIQLNHASYLEFHEYSLAKINHLIPMFRTSYSIGEKAWRDHRQKKIRTHHQQQMPLKFNEGQK